VWVLTLLSLWLAQASQYAGTEACRVCHPAQYRDQSATHHAHALTPAKADQPGEWAFGAGAQAITFVRRLDAEHYLEEGQSWYRALNGYAPTPGHTKPGGVRDRIFDPSASILRCFACHSTGLVRVAAGGVIIPSELGVRCEACHGPSAAHAQAPDRFRPAELGRVSADEVNQICGACHRMPAPAGSVNLGDPWNTRHQPLMLAASNCFKKSGGKLSCLTCHSPHAALKRDSRSYDTTCRQCHQGVTHVAPISDRTCIDCHMPRVQATPYLVFPNHRIAIYSRDDGVTPKRRP
jgi:Cytochrome c554 and c-prime